MLIGFKNSIIMPTHQYLAGLGDDGFKVTRADRIKPITVPALWKPLANFPKSQCWLPTQHGLDLRPHFSSPIQHA